MPAAGPWRSSNCRRRPRRRAATSWLRVTPASTSALCVTSVPASVTGDEPPAMAMERMFTATCPRAAGHDDLAGVLHQLERAHRAGDERDDRPLPELVAAADDGRRHLEQLAREVAVARAHEAVLGGVASSRPRPDAGGRRAGRCPRPPRRARRRPRWAGRRRPWPCCATSCLVGTRSSPVYGSTICTPSPKLVKPTRPASSTTSFLRVAPGQDELARGRAHRLLDDVAGDADDAPGVDRRAGPGEDLAGLLVLDEHAGPLQDFERPEMDVGEVVVGQYAELAAVAACASRMGVPSHGRTSLVPVG